MPVAPDRTAVAWSFSVKLDGLPDAVAFSGCDGLSAQYEVTEVREGGVNSYIHHLPTRVIYTNVKLTRPVDEHSQAVATWFSTFRSRLEAGTAVITALDGNRNAVATWSLTEVIPVKYTGPKLDAASTTGATETLELAHHGFMDS